MANSRPASDPGDKEDPKHIGIFSPSYPWTSIVEAFGDDKKNVTPKPHDLDAFKRGAEAHRKAAEEAGNKEEEQRAARILERIDETKKSLKKTTE